MVTLNNINKYKTILIFFGCFGHWATPKTPKNHWFLHIDPAWLKKGSSSWTPFCAVPGMVGIYILCDCST
mgnify:CR=1 FL=1